MSDPSPDTPSPALAELGDLPRFLEDSARWHLIECFEQHGNGTSAVGYDPPRSCCSDAGAIPRLRAAAARLREQDAEITRLRRICEPLDGNILQARLDKLDRIEAALGDEIPADLRYYARVRTSRGSNLLRRLADALEDTDG